MTDRNRSVPADPTSLRAQVDAQIEAHRHLAADPERFARAVALTCSQSWALSHDELRAALAALARVDEQESNLRRDRARALRVAREVLAATTPANDEEG